MMRDAVDSGLTLISAKCEIISHDRTTCGTLLVSLPGAHMVLPSSALVLGSPLGDSACTSAVLMDKVEALRLGDRLTFLSAHDVLVLLRNCFALPQTDICPSYCPLFSNKHPGKLR